MCHKPHTICKQQYRNYKHYFAKVGNKESRVSTIVIRGATDNYMDDIERAVDDGVNVFKGVCKDGRLTAGGGSTEIELARQVKCEFN